MAIVNYFCDTGIKKTMRIRNNGDGRRLTLHLLLCCAEREP